MASKTDIINAAIDHLGEDAVVNPTQQREAARRMTRRYDMLRDAVLEEHKWNFAMRRAQIASIATPTGHWGAGNVFTKPADCLKVRAVAPKGVKWRVEGVNILTNASAPLDILYTGRVTDPTTHSATFNEALAARLAWATAWAVTGDKGIVDRAERAYYRFIAQARHADALEQSEEALESFEWLEAMIDGIGNPVGPNDPWWG